MARPHVNETDLSDNTWGRWGGVLGKACLQVRYIWLYCGSVLKPRLFACGFSLMSGKLLRALFRLPQGYAFCISFTTQGQ